MDLILSLIAVGCFVASFVRVVLLLDGMDRRTKNMPYWRFLTLGAGEAALCMLTAGGAIAIVTGGADLWVYALVLAVGATSLADRRTNRGGRSAC